MLSYQRADLLTTKTLGIMISTLINWWYHPFSGECSLLKSGLQLVSPELVEMTVDGKDIQIIFHYWNKSYSVRCIGSDTADKGKDVGSFKSSDSQ